MIRWQREGNGNKKVIPAHLYFQGWPHYEHNSVLLLVTLGSFPEFTSIKSVMVFNHVVFSLPGKKCLFPSSYSSWLVICCLSALSMQIVTSDVHMPGESNYLIKVTNSALL